MMIMLIVGFYGLLCYVVGLMVAGSECSKVTKSPR